ncbi:MAG TPA: LysR family transcriptional regulator [Spirochaetota bacterium]|nr:LysR family transcriptional regulator [Spirochaetota bacterium]HPS85492.1 LysR family transcriptional regulator [Spirochaetota bacterium]
MKDKNIDDSVMPEVKVHVWFEKDNGVYFGHGRYELLLHISELGSLKLAAEEMGISYRGAWGKIKKTEEVIGKPLIYKDNNKEGYKLTEFGKDFVNEFKSYYDDVTEFARKRGLELLHKVKIL